MPYYVIFEIDEIAKDSKICSNKKIYLLETNYKIDKKKFINHEFEITSNNKCIILNFKNKYSYIFGYSINKNDNLEIKTSYNLKIVTYKFLKYFLTFLILFFLTVTYFNQKKLFDFLIYFVSVISTLILVLIRDPNLLTGLRYYRGGADGLLHYSHGKDILQNLINFF